MQKTQQDCWGIKTADKKVTVECNYFNIKRIAVLLLIAIETGVVEGAFILKVKGVSLPTFKEVFKNLCLKEKFSKEYLMESFDIFIEAPVLRDSKLKSPP